MLPTSSSRPSCHTSTTKDTGSVQRVQKCHLRRAHGTLMLRKTMKIKITDCIRADNRFAECHRARTQASPMAAPSPAARTSSGPRHPMRVPLPEPLRHHARRVDIHPAEATLARNPALRPGDAARLPHTPRAHGGPHHPHGRVLVGEENLKDCDRSARAISGREAPLRRPPLTETTTPLHAWTLAPAAKP